LAAGITSVSDIDTNHVRVRHLRPAGGRALRRTATIAAGAALALLLLPAAAHAEYFFTKSGAQRVARDFASKKYNIAYDDTAAVCYAQFQPRPDYQRFKYHRWVCGWSDGDCGGVVRVTGHTGAGSYASLVMRGVRCS
jgi:hypothetical protein